MRALLRVFVSLRLTVWVLVVLTSLAMVGTLIPQNLDPVYYVDRFGSTAGTWLMRLGLADLYHSTVFVGLMTFLLCSAVVCTWIRVRFTHRRLLRRLETVRLAEILYLPVRWQRANDATGSLSMPPLGPDWRHRTDGEGRTYALRTRGGLALLGGGLIHIGLMVILSAGMISQRFSVEFAVAGTTGSEISLPPLVATRVAVDADRLRGRLRQIMARVVHADQTEVDRLQARIVALEHEYRAGVASPAWRVHLDDLWVDGPDVASQQAGIRHWNTAVTLTDAGGQRLATGVIQVNSPFTAGDYTLYQSNWGKVYTTVQVEVVPADDSVVPGSWPQLLTLPQGRSVRPDWTSATFQLNAFYPDLRVDKQVAGDERFFSASDELNQPAAQIEAFDDRGAPTGRAWAFAPSMAMMGHRFGGIPGLRFAFVGAVSAPKTGLKVGYDPGTTWVWLGGFLMSLGLTLAFYVRYVEEWILVEPGLRLTVAVTGNRPPPTLNARLDDLLTELGYAATPTEGISPASRQEGD